MLKNLGQTLNITHPLKEQMMTQKKKSLGEVEERGSNEWIKEKGEKEGRKGTTDEVERQEKATKKQIMKGIFLYL